MFRLLVTTAMKPPSDFTTPRTLICPISRHFFPVEHPEPGGLLQHRTEEGIALAIHRPLLFVRLRRLGGVALAGGSRFFFGGFSNLRLGRRLGCRQLCRRHGLFLGLECIVRFRGLGRRSGLRRRNRRCLRPRRLHPSAGWSACGAGPLDAASAALVSLVFICCSDFATLRALSMASGFCAQRPPPSSSPLPLPECLSSAS